MSRYDGLEVLENSSQYGGYMSLTNYSNAFMCQVENAGILSSQRLFLAMDMLTFKHDERRPYTPQDTFAKRFKVSVKSIKEAVSDLKNVGFLNIIKRGRNNTYDLSPFLKCLASFVEHVHNGVDFCIKKLIREVLSGEYVPQMVKEEEKQVEPVFDEVITAALDKLSEEDRKAAIPVIESHIHRLSSESIEFYIPLAIGKENFGGYLNTCMEKGSDEEVKQRKEEAANPKPKPQPKNNYGKKPVRNEPSVGWLGDTKKEEAEKEAYIEAFNNKYHSMTQMNFKSTTKKEAIKNQEEFITWYNKECKKHENENAFVEWCGQMERERLIKELGMKSA